MRLLNARLRRLELFHGTPPYPYAIVSHRWGAESEEVLFTDIIPGDESRAEAKGKGYDKILGCCFQALEDNLSHVWLDTCCIDKSNNTELSEALNSMFAWYHNAQVCYVYLHDVDDLSNIFESEWFKRGWTLQELIAPKDVKFFAKDWAYIGAREDLIDQLAELTGIDAEVLERGSVPPTTSIAQRMYWAVDRKTTKVEDIAYSLLGLFGVHLEATYGINHQAFRNFQRKLVDDTRADQTLFAWYRVPPEDVEMADAGAVVLRSANPPPNTVSPVALPSNPTAIAAISAHPNDPSSDVTNPPPSPPHDSASQDATAYPLNSTGFLAISPSQYLKVYEIPEESFCKNIADMIQALGDDHTYHHHFSISNNLVHITLPIKRIDDNLWRAALRCSLDPPSQTLTQRPLVLYLEEIPSGNFVRTHIPVSPEILAEEDVSTDGVRGSLERLGDDEIDLNGYSLQDIHIVGQHREYSFKVLRSKPPSDRDRPLETLTEPQRILRLLPHPHDVRATNVIVFGSPGVGTASVVNQILGANFLIDNDRLPMATVTVDHTLDFKPIRIFHVAGLKDHFVTLPGFHACIPNMYQFVHLVREAGGIHLMVFCMVGSKVTASVKCNYHLIQNGIFKGRVPMVLVATGLGEEKRMESWWEKHRDDEDVKAMHPLDHACVTVFPGDTPVHQKKFQDSILAIRRLITDFIDLGPAQEYIRTDVREWFVEMGRKVMKLLPRSRRRDLTVEQVANDLKDSEQCKLSESDARALAEKLFMDDDEMEL